MTYNRDWWIDLLIWLDGSPTRSWIAIAAFHTFFFAVGYGLAWAVTR